MLFQISTNTDWNSRYGIIIIRNTWLIKRRWRAFEFWYFFWFQNILGWWSLQENQLGSKKHLKLENQIYWKNWWRKL
jgi:hypothetical protein